MIMKKFKKIMALALAVVSVFAAQAVPLRLQLLDGGQILRRAAGSFHCGSSPFSRAESS